MKERPNSKALPQSFIERMGEADRKKYKVKTVEERAEALQKADEATIQRLTEAYLIQLGYERRTADNILRCPPASGWFIHYSRTKTKGNPIILDLLILNDSTKKFKELELKTETGKIKPHQQALIDQGASLARSAKEAMAKIKEWHESHDK